MSVEHGVVDRDSSGVGRVEVRRWRSRAPRLHCVCDSVTLVNWWRGLRKQRRGERVLSAMGFYRPARMLAQRLFKPETWEQRQRQREFFSSYIRSGDLVIDVGAHVGEYVEKFLDCGARVVAVEPVPDLAKLLRRRFHQISVEQVAVGARRGSTQLFLGRSLSHSTTALSFRDEPPVGVGYTGVSLDVQVVTLDDLTDKYGEPSFIKIDAEGSEADVLRGLTGPFRSLSFEYHLERLEAAEAAAACLPGASFRAVLSDSPTAAVGPFDSRGLLERLAMWAREDAGRYGEVYATRAANSVSSHH